MIGTYVDNPHIPVENRLTPFPSVKEDLPAPVLDVLTQLFQGTVHPDPVQNFLTYFAGLDAGAEGEFVMAQTAQDFGMSTQWATMMHDGVVSQIQVWLAALFGAFSTNPPTESSPIQLTVVDDASVNSPEIVNAGYFRRDVHLGRTFPTDTLSFRSTFLIKRNPT